MHISIETKPKANANFIETITIIVYALYEIRPIEMVLFFAILLILRSNLLSHLTHSSLNKISLVHFTGNFYLKL